LDFGLAKLTRGEAGIGESASGAKGHEGPDQKGKPDLHQAATATMDEEYLTSPGMVMGTVAYMSPEQARGEQLDARTDLFSFGAVLYEMATGQPAFSGTTTAIIHDAILNREPTSPTELNPELPSKLQDIINKALEKDREVRYQVASEMRADLKRLKRDTESGRTVSSAGVATTPTTGTVRRANGIGPLWLRRRLTLLLSALGTVVIGAGIVWFVSHRAPSEPAEIKQRRLTDNSSDNPVQGTVISPDGKYLAYGDQSGIHIKLIGTEESQTIAPPMQLKGMTASWVPVSWFPDDTRLVAEGSEPGLHPSIWVVSILSGTAHELRDNAYGGRVSPDGTQIVFAAGTMAFNYGLVVGRELWVMGPSGEDPRRIAVLDENSGFSSIVWSPDNQHLACSRYHEATDKQEFLVEIRDVKGAAPVLVSAVRWGGDLCWLPDGRLIYSVAGPEPPYDSNLWEIRIEGHNGRPIGKPKRLTNWAGSYLAGLSNTADGKHLTFLRQTSHEDIYVGDLEAGGTRLKSPPRRLTSSESANEPTAWTADSKAVLFLSNREGQLAVYRQRFDQDSPERLTTGQEAYVSPRLSSDGSWVICSVLPKEGQGASTPIKLIRLPASGGPPQLVLTSSGLVDYRCAKAPADLCVLSEQSADRKRLTFIDFDPVRGRGHELKHIDTDPTTFYGSDLSPDGKLLAIEKIGEAQGHIRILPVGEGKAQDIKVNGWGRLNSLDWTADGKGFLASSRTGKGATLLHIDLSGNAQPLWSERTGVVAWGVPSPDGKKVAIFATTTVSNVWMIENF
jgi:Tol biopolymer transport system component